MKIGVNTFLWTANFTAEHLPLIPRAKELGLDGVEFSAFDFAAFPAAQVRSRLQESGMSGTFCSALFGDMSLATADPAIRSKTIEFLRTGIKTVAEAELDVFAGPFCSAVGLLPGRRRTQDEWDRCIDGLKQVAETAAEYEVNIAVEPLNRFETFFLNTAADAKKLCEEVGHSRIGILYDTFHANIEEKSQMVAIQMLGQHIYHVHTCENDRGIPGSGPIDWNGVVSALQEIGYDKWCVIESFGPGIQEIAAAACIWRDLAPTPEDIPEQGAINLRKLFEGGSFC